MKRYTAGILLQDGKILLGKRADSRAFYPGVWDLIGGHCQEHEDYAEGMIRELQEELGIIPLAFELFRQVEEATAFEMYIYVVHSWKGEPRNVCPEEHTAIEWLSPEHTRDLELADNRYLELFDAINKEYFQKE